MRFLNSKIPIGRWLAIAILAGGLAVAGTAAHAQVVVVVNGSPITVLDIEQRTKLITVSTQKKPTRKEVIDELIDERLKISFAKRYGFELPDSEVDSSFENIAKRQHMTVPQFTQMMERSGLSPDTLKARIRAEMTWTQLVRGRYSSSLTVAESDVNKALAERTGNNDVKDEIGYIYTLYPITVVATRDPKVIEAKRQVAESLRNRFDDCNRGLALARSMRDVAVREPVNKSSADIPAPLREVLDKLQIGQVTAPEVTAQGIQMYALCGKRQSTAESPLKHEVRDQIYQKRYNAEAKRFLEDIRKQAMIEYK